MTWNQIMGLISTVALSLPIILLLVTKLASYRSFPALLAYYTIVVIYNLLTEGYIKASPEFVSYWGIGNNLLDAPLMLIFLTYFATTPALKKRIQFAVATILALEVVLIAVFGFSVKTITIVMAPGLLLILCLSVHFFVRHTKITIIHQKATGKALMIGSLLIAYGCYSIIYIMFYLLKNEDVENTFLVYYLVSTFCSLLMSAGIFIERKRVKKLSELKVVRRELSELYGNEKTASPLRQAVLDFDKEKWN
jgi:hypothetical protein